VGVGVIAGGSLRMASKAFLLVVEDLHSVVYGTKGVCLFQEVLSKL
jgi:hypothetical protein